MTDGVSPVRTDTRARDAEIARRRQRGESYACIGEAVGLTGGGVQRVCRRLGVVSPDVARNRPPTTRGRILIVLGAVDFDAAESLIARLAASEPMDKQRFFSESHGWRHEKTTAKSVNTLQRSVHASLGGLVRDGLVCATGPGRYALAERVSVEREVAA